MLQHLFLFFFQLNSIVKHGSTELNATSDSNLRFVLYVRSQRVVKILPSRAIAALARVTSAEGGALRRQIHSSARWRSRVQRSVWASPANVQFSERK